MTWWAACRNGSSNDWCVMVTGDFRVIYTWVKDFTKLLRYLHGAMSATDEMVLAECVEYDLGGTDMKEAYEMSDVYR